MRMDRRNTGNSRISIVLIILGVLALVGSYIVAEKSTLDSISEMKKGFQENRRLIERLRDACRIQDVQTVTVAAYTPSERETNADPGHTAAMWRPRPGMIAISRDLLRNGWSFGSKVYIEGLGVFFIGDLMNERYAGRIDVLLFDYDKAMAFGKKKNKTAVLLKENPGGEEKNS